MTPSRFDVWAHGLILWVLIICMVLLMMTLVGILTIVFGLIGLLGGAVLALIGIGLIVATLIRHE